MQKHFKIAIIVSLLFSILFISISLANADIVNINYGGSSNLCINNGIDSCSFGGIQEQQIINPSNPPTYTVNYNYTNMSIISNLTTNESTNQTIVKSIEDKGKEFNLIYYLIIGILAFLILIACVLFDRSKKGFSKDGLLFVITSLIFSIGFLVISIVYKDIYALSMLIIISLIFMINIVVLLITDKKKNKFDIFGTISISVILLAFSLISLFNKNYLFFSISLACSIILIIVIIAIIIDKNTKSKSI